MANITVSTSSNFDATANLALNNGERVTVTSGATLTINSDNRYAQNAAAPETITISEGTVIVDGTQVWWVPFDASTGNVPALDAQGTLNVTVGGVNVGELLGVWDAYAVAKPLVAGVAMPATGFVKFRLTVAAIADNDVLTFGNGATATVNSATGGQRGWIDLCGKESYTANFQSGGIYCNARSQLRVTGDWFEIGETTGVAGQVLQHYLPIYCWGVQIETAAGSGVYEWYVSYPVNTLPTASMGTNLDNSLFGRVFTSTTTGAITLGYNSQFYTPPAGCKVRVPNICVNTVTSTNYDTYLTTLTDTQTWRLFGLEYSDVEISNLILSNGRFHSRNSAKYYITNSAFYGGSLSWSMQLNPPSSKDWKFENITVSSASTGYGRQMLGCYGDKIVLKDAFLPVTNGSYPLFYSSTNITIENLTSIAWNLFGSSNAAPIFLNNCKDVTVKNVRGYCPGLQMLTLNNVENIDVDDAGFITRDIVNGVSQGISIGMTGTVRKARFNDFKQILGKLGGHGWDYMSVISGEEIVWSNWGTYASPYEVNVAGYRGSAVPLYAWNVGSVKKQSMFNIWLSSPTGSEIYVMTATSTDIIYNYCGQIHTVTPTVRPMFNGLYANSRTRNTAATIPSGTEYLPYQHLISNTTSTTSQLRFAFFVFPIEDVRFKTAVTSSGAQRDATNLYLPTLGDYIEITTDDILGVTALTTAAITSTGSLAITYDIDQGTGFSGTYKTLNTANVAAESVSATGFRLRVKAEATATGNNFISVATINATTSSADMEANPYPIAEPNLNITNVVTNSTLAVIRTTDGKTLFLSDALATSQILRPGWSADVATLLRVRKAGYSSFVLPYTLTYKDTTIPIDQEASSIPATNPGALSITVTNHGASPVTWNGKQWSITITATGGETPAQIANYINYNLANQSRSFDSAFYNMQWPEMVLAVGSNYETARGTLYGSAGTILKGVRVMDGSGNEITGFTRMQSDDGTYYTPTVSYALTVYNVVVNSRILVRRTDTSTVIANELVTTGSFVYTYTYVSDIPIEIVLRKASEAPYYQEWRTITTLASSNNTQVADQISDE